MKIQNYNKDRKERKQGNINMENKMTEHHVYLTPINVKIKINKLPY